MVSAVRSRRDFVRAAGLSAAGLLLGTPFAVRAAHAAGPRIPDTIVINAKIYTIDDQMPRAQAFAIKDARFMAVGSTADIKTMANRQTQVVDAQGMTIIPGFIDCHNHAPGTQLLTEVIVGHPYEVE